MHMHPNIKRVAVATLAVTALAALHPVLARAEQHITCPAASRPLQAAEAIFVYGSLQEPWGQLKDPEVVTGKDGAVTTKYPLPDEPLIGKWIICHYIDGSYKPVKLLPATKGCEVRYKRGARIPDIVCK
jgi:hypothetical protein